jgi:hypothetical protein
MSKKQRPQTNSTTPAYDTQRLRIRGERRTEPDWDAYISILLAHALHTVGADDLDEGIDDE